MPQILQDYKHITKHTTGRELSQFYAERKIDQTDLDTKIAALQAYLEPYGGMLIASADGAERELRALEYLYLIRHGFDE